MTRYAYNPSTRTIHATWSESTQHADTIVLVATTDESVEDSDVHLLLAALSCLSTAAWKSYTHPVATAGDTAIVNSEAWIRSRMFESLDSVCDLVHTPNLLTSTWKTHETAGWYAREVGRHLRSAGSTELTEAVLGELEDEIASVKAACAGALTNRAAQALQLTTTLTTDSHILAASEVFSTGKFYLSCVRDLELSSAAVAAVHWAYAALVVTGEYAHCCPSDVIYLSDIGEAVPAPTVSTVVSMLLEDYNPRRVVTALIADAQRVADGELHDSDVVYDRIDEVYEMLMKHELHRGVVSGFAARLCALNPARPALDLLEDMFTAITAALLMYISTGLDRGLPNTSCDDYDDQHERLTAKLYLEFMAKTQAVVADLPLL